MVGLLFHPRGYLPHGLGADRWTASIDYGVDRYINEGSYLLVRNPVESPDASKLSLSQAEDLRQVEMIG